jgi:predicted kinase
MEAVILIGIQATGKSTFYQQRFANTHVRINLDMLKTRTREDILLEACIRAKQSFVVDNTNVLASEREKYIRLAKAGGYAVIGYYFQSRLPDALQRNQQREGKAVIPEKGVLGKSHAMQRPSYAEGFDRLYYVSIGPENSFIVESWVGEDG